MSDLFRQEGPLRLRALEPGDRAGMVALHRKVFALPEGAEPFSPELWDWKFGGNPQGLLHGTVAEHEEQGLLGAYPSQPCRFWVDGELRLGSQIVDLMVARRARTLGPRPGLFVHLGRLFHELYCGTEADRQSMYYGWPVPAWPSGQRHLGYRNVRDWNFLFRELHQPAQGPRGLAQDLELREVERFADDLDQLNRHLQGQIRMTLDKGAAYLNWRFAEHPDRCYRLYELRGRDGGLRGAAVYGLRDFLRPNTAFVMELLVPAEDQDALVALLSACEERAAEDGSEVLAGAWNPADPRFMSLQRLGYLLLDTGYFLTWSTFADQDVRWYRQHWFYSAGDSDLL